MMDLDGNGRISYNELLQTAKDSMEASRKMGDGRDLPEDILRLLDRVSQMCITAPAAVRRKFESVDRNRSGACASPRQIQTLCCE